MIRTFGDMGKLIKKRRKALKMTQDTLAKELGYGDNRSAISKWETGIAPVPTEKIANLCAALDCDAGYLFGEYDVPKIEHEGIRKLTGLSDKASVTLGNLANEENLFLFLDELLSLSIGERYFLLKRFHEYKQFCAMEKSAAIAIQRGDMADDDFMIGPDGKEYRPAELDHAKRYGLFNFTNEIVRFAERTTKGG